MGVAAATFARQNASREVAATSPTQWVVLRRADILELPRWKREIIRRGWRWLGLPITGMWQGMGVYDTEEEATEAAASIPGGQVLPLPRNRLLPLEECRYGKAVAPNSESKAMRQPPRLPRLRALDDRDIGRIKEGVERVLENLDTDPAM
jgi:hypothetical protein